MWVKALETHTDRQGNTVGKDTIVAMDDAKAGKLIAAGKFEEADRPAWANDADA
jgi:hypothetical protein